MRVGRRISNFVSQKRISEALTSNISATSPIGKGTHVELAERLTDTLHEMEQDGTIKNIVEKYGFDADQVLVGGNAYEK